MEAVGGCNIHVHIRMVDAMETPEKGHGMVEQMPDVNGEIKEKNTGQYFQPVRQRYFVEQADFLRRRCLQHGYDGRGEEQMVDGAVEKGQGNIGGPALWFRGGRDPVGAFF